MPTLVVGMRETGNSTAFMATQAWPWHPISALDRKSKRDVQNKKRGKIDFC